MAYPFAPVGLLKKQIHQQDTPPFLISIEHNFQQ